MGKRLPSGDNRKSIRKRRAFLPKRSLKPLLFDLDHYVYWITGFTLRITWGTIQTCVRTGRPPNHFSGSPCIPSFHPLCKSARLRISRSYRIALCHSSLARFLWHSKILHICTYFWMTIVMSSLLGNLQSGAVVFITRKGEKLKNSQAACQSGSAWLLLSFSPFPV